MAERDQGYVEFVASASASLRRTACLVCGDRHRADDVVQDALYKPYQSWPKVRRVGNPFAHARRMVVNAAHDGAGGRGGRRFRRPTYPSRWVGTTSSTGTPIGTKYWRHCADSAATACLRRTALLRGPVRRADRRDPRLLRGTVKSQAARGLSTLRQAIDRTRRRSRTL